MYGTLEEQGKHGRRDSGKAYDKEASFIIRMCQLAVIAGDGGQHFPRKKIASFALYHCEQLACCILLSRKKLNVSTLTRILPLNYAYFFFFLFYIFCSYFLQHAQGGGVTRGRQDSNITIVNNKMSEIADVNVDSIIDRLLEGKCTECMQGQRYSFEIYSQRQ